MDQGIIANLKHHYRSFLVKRLISAIDAHQPHIVTVLDAMRLKHKAWGLVKQSTIANCFAHCHFKLVEAEQPTHDPEDEADDDMPLADLVMTTFHWLI